jgi:uncharacterized protein YchJ
MDRWSAAWAAKDVDTYLRFYATGFQPGQNRSRAQWEEHRRRMLGKPGSIGLELVAPKYERAGEVVSVTFTQRYKSDDFSDVARKRVDWVKDGERWRILREQSL